MAANLLCYSAAGKWAKPPWLKCLAKINASYITFDDVDYQNLVRQSPKNLLNFCDKSKLNILDEVQKAPAVFDTVKMLIDDGFLFLLAGSSSLHLLENVSETLAGRVRVRKLEPCAWGGESNRNSHTFPSFWKKAKIGSIGAYGSTKRVGRCNALRRISRDRGKNR